MVGAKRSVSCREQERASSSAAESGVKTRNAKGLRRVIRAPYLGQDPGDLSSLENPGAVDEVRAISGKR
jgi:hypothetical protein